VALLLGALTALPSRVALAQTCEVPLFIQQGSGGAKVMLLADTSASMDEALYSDSYNPATAYTGNFTRTSTYNVSSSGNKSPRSFKSTWPSTPTAWLVTSAGGNSGTYSGNYLNWVFFHATVAQRGAIPRDTRITALKTILVQIVSRASGLDFGLTIFNGSNGGVIKSLCGATTATLLTQVNALKSDSYTPLAETAEDILDYFKRTDATAPITMPCQSSFMLVVTDGMPTMDIDVSAYLRDADGDGNDPGSCTSIGAPYPDSYNCSEYFDDVTYYMAHNDLRPDMSGTQSVNSYIVGYTIDHPLLEEAAANGNGLYYRANNAVDLFLSIEFALQDILRQVSSGSAVAVVSTERGADNKLYRGKFMPVDWTGFLECYELPFANGDAPIWEAGQVMASRATGDRAIFTVYQGQQYDFTAANAANLRVGLAAASEGEAADLINWGRGDDVLGLRDRTGWSLGPIIHSTPVVVGSPADFSMTESYQAFYDANEHRQRIVYVGANDGMLHAFDAISGQEEWAFVPEFALPNFRIMADTNYCHVYSVDQTVTVNDVEMSGAWRTVLVGGGREGGDSIFAIDVTDPQSPSFLWQAQLPGAISFNSNVEIATIAGEAVALVGSGLNTVAKTAWLYGYRLIDGTLLGSVQLSTNAAGARNKTARPSSIDLDLDGNVDLVYVADMMGEVYRFAVNGSPDPDNWSRSTLYSGTQEITADPTTAYGPNGQVYVYFGTGAYLDMNDVSTTTAQDFICVFDRHDLSTITKGDLADQSSTISDVTASDGWRYAMDGASGLRVVEQAVVVAETVIFTAFAPTLETCVAGGTSFLYQMRYDDGNKTEEQDSLDDREQELGGGVASHPVVDLSTGTVVVQSSDASISVLPIAAVIQRMTVRSWQENYDHVTQPSTGGVVQ
jgi:type IV pilus assembly protein PilY1